MELQLIARFLEWMLPLKLGQQMIIMIDGFVDLHHIIQVLHGMDMTKMSQLIIMARKILREFCGLIL